MESHLRFIANHYGIDHQTLKLCEELQELSQAVRKLNKYWKPEVNTQRYKNNVAEEIADVIIMIMQIIYLYKIDEDKIIDYEYYKINRQLKRIKEENNE